LIAAQHRHLWQHSAACTEFLASGRFPTNRLMVAINVTDPLSKQSSISLQEISNRPMVIDDNFEVERQAPVFVFPTLRIFMRSSP
jgi:hypothetical protein